MNELQTFVPTSGDTMPNRPEKEFYTEAEAAQELGISITRLRMLLDRYIFNDGTRRPHDLQLLPTDLVLLRYWTKDLPDSNLVHMPRRDA